MHFQILINFVTIFETLVKQQDKLVLELKELDFVKIYQSSDTNVLYGNKFRVSKAPNSMSRTEGKTYCKQSKGNLFYISNEKPPIDQIFTKYEITQAWDGVFHSRLSSLVIDEESNVISYRSGDITILNDESMNTIAENQCVGIYKEGSVFKYKVTDCGTKLPVLCIHINPFIQQSSTVENIGEIRDEFIEYINKNLYFFKNTIKRLKNKIRIIPESKPEKDLEYVETLNLGNEMEPDLKFIEDTITDLLNSLKIINSALDLPIVHSNLICVQETVRNILDYCEKIIVDPNSFLLSTTPKTNYFNLYREESKLIVSLKSVKGKNETTPPVAISDGNIFDNLELDISLFDIGLSLSIIVTFLGALLKKVIQNYRMKKARKPISKQIRQFKEIETKGRSVAPKSYQKIPLKGTKRKLPLHLADSIQSIEMN